MQSQTIHGYLPTSIVDRQRCTLRPSRSPSAAAESAPAAEYQEWPLHGFLKRARIGNETTFNLEFHLADLPEHLELSVPFKALGSSCRRMSARPQVSHSAVAFSKTHHITLRPPTKRAPWTPEEDAISVKMRKEGNCLWKEIYDALSSRSPGRSKRYSMKYNNSASGSRKRRRL
jgi:hypothetical protein